MTTPTPTLAPTLREVAESEVGNPLRRERIHHVEFWVVSANQADVLCRKA